MMMVSSQCEAKGLERSPLHLLDLFTYLCRFSHDCTLAALARTSKTLHYPAIQALWTRSGSLTELIMCFPEDVWVREYSVSPYSTLVS